MASQQEIRPCYRRFQNIYHVSLHFHSCGRYNSVSVLCDPTHGLLYCSNPEVWNDITFPSDAVQSELKLYISKRLTPQPIKVRADIEVTCFAYEGIDAIKRSLRTAESRNTENNEVKVRLVSPPLYVLTNICLDKNLGISRLEQAIIDVKASIEEAGGSLQVKMQPKAVTETDDAELQALMEKRERENAEVSGDESVSDSDEGIPETI